MELRHLRYFVAVAEELNFTRAAARLHVAQPALSTQIKDLEEELGVPLFERGRGKIKLTVAGEAFLDRAYPILGKVSEAIDAAQTAGGVRHGRLALGFLGHPHLEFIRPALDAFRRANPKVEIDLFQGMQSEQLVALREGRIDLAFINLPAPLHDTPHTKVLRVPLVAALPPGHPLLKKSVVPLAVLAKENFVFCTRASRPEFYDNVLQQCASHGVKLRIVKEVSGPLEAVVGLIQLKMGVSLLPYFPEVAKYLNVEGRPVRPKLWIEFALAWRKGERSSCVEDFRARVSRLIGKMP